MPELPEVETVRRGIEPLIGVPVARVRIARRDVVRDAAGRRRGRIDPAALLQGSSLQLTRRHGKQLALVGSSGACALVHLGMSGQLLLLGPGGRVAGGHAHIAWTMEDGRRLVFRDPRRFGGVWLLPDERALDVRWNAMGPDGLYASAATLGTALGVSRRPVKAGLLDQSALAGIGNIYADEALFDAGIDPHRACATLSRSEWQRLASSIRLVLREGLRRGGSTLRDYRRPDGTAGDGTLGHRVYGRAGQPCIRCEQPLSRSLLAQRTTVWCASCQPPVTG